MQIRKIWIKRVSSGNIDSNTEIMCEKPMTTNVSSTFIMPSSSPFLPHPEEIRSQDRPQYRLPHPPRDGHGRPRRPPHHGHHPRGHPLHKIQDSAECEEVKK